MFPTLFLLQNCYFNWKWNRNEPWEQTSGQQVISLSVQQKTYQTALLEFPFKKLQFCNRYITVQLQQFKKWTQDTLFLTASSDEAVTAHVSILNPSLMQNLDKLPHSAACQANAGNYIQSSRNNSTTLSHRGSSLKLFQQDVWNMSIYKFYYFLTSRETISYSTVNGNNSMQIMALPIQSSFSNGINFLNEANNTPTN